MHYIPDWFTQTSFLTFSQIGLHMPVSPPLYLIGFHAPDIQPPDQSLTSTGRMLKVMYCYILHFYQVSITLWPENELLWNGTQINDKLKETVFVIKRGVVDFLFQEWFIFYFHPVFDKIL